jgi:hypothetical protein
LSEVSSGVYKFSIKNSDGSKYLRYTDSAFEIAAGNFSLNASGNVTASNIRLTGDITANYITANTGGSIAGWNVNSTYLEKDGTRLNAASNNAYLAIGGITAYNANNGIWLGEDGSGNYRFSMKKSDGSKYFKWDGDNLDVNAGNFSLDTSGNVTASNIRLTGDITANYITANTGGSIAGWNVNSTYLEKDGTRLNAASNNAYLAIGGITAYNANNGIWLGEDGSGNYRFSMKKSDGSKYFKWDGDNLDVNAGNFSLDTSGNVTASNIRLTGDITANYITANTAGQIGGWNIDSNAIYHGTEGSDATFTSNAGDITLGAGFISSKGFYIDSSGNATLSGSVSASVGNIGGWTLGVTALTAPQTVGGSVSAVTPSVHPPMLPTLALTEPLSVALPDESI